jgi:hypothetical protein
MKELSVARLGMAAADETLKALLRCAPRGVCVCLHAATDNLR